jgi:hypothetical protein
MNFSILAAAICEKDAIWGFKQSIQVWYMVQNHCMNIIHQSCVVMPCNLWEPCSPVLSVLKFCGSCSSQILSGCLSVSVYKENTAVLCSLSKMRLSYGNLKIWSWSLAQCRVGGYLQRSICPDSVFSSFDYYQVVMVGRGDGGTNFTTWHLCHFSQLI